VSGWTTATVPAVTVAQMREVDRVMVEDLGIVLLQMMENAGRALALQAGQLGGRVSGREIVVLCGSGGGGWSPPAASRCGGPGSPR
jgi:NAD(P)H-hydrate epimerase